jgi:N6-L-threonylcarbamoyladenine synthase
MLLLTIETTCDETAAAVINDKLEVLSSVVASQDALHNRFGGVVPEIASRAHVERILPVIDETLRKANVTLADLDGVAVANTPGLAGSLLVGLTAAKTICLACDLPLLAVNHLQAHIYACRIASGRDVFPCIGLVVSGGHSNIYRCEGPTDFTPLGGTIDDAAGEAFDKVASLLGLDDSSSLNFSFSGLKTAVRYLIAGTGKLQPGQGRGEGAASSLMPQGTADIAAAFQEAVIDCLVGKAELAIAKTGYRTLCVGGGVAANGRFRARLEESAQANGYELHVPPLKLCTDNAVMGAIAIERLRAGLFEDLSLDINPVPERVGAQ